MKQENMNVELFESVLQSLGLAPLTVSLQGEGEYCPSAVLVNG